MILKLCIANAISLWMSADRDATVANAIKEHTNRVDTLITYVVKPTGVPVSCQSARDFIDKWFPSALANHGVTVDEIMHSACSSTACSCDSNKDVCATVLSRGKL